MIYLKKFTIRNASLIGLIVAPALALTACGGGSGSTATPAAQPQAVTIQFALKAGATPVSCGTPINGLGIGGKTAQLQDLRFYVSDVHLMTANDTQVPVTLTEDGQWQHDGSALIDMENGLGDCKNGTAATNLTLRGTVPAGNYTGVGFTVGLPVAQNHSNVATAPAPLDVSALAWSWQSGRKFFQLELNPDGGVLTPANDTATPPVPATTSSTFYVHLGAADCTGSPALGETAICARPNRMAFHSHAFNASTQQIVLDLSTLLAGSDLSRNAGGAPGCMSSVTDPECTPLFSALKIDLATGLPIDSGHGQQLFRVEPKL